MRSRANDDNGANVPVGAHQDNHCCQSGNKLISMSRIRPEQRGHAKFLRRGRSSRPLQFILLTVAAIAATVGLWAALFLSDIPTTV
jgi:hypothetical protein